MQWVDCDAYWKLSPEDRQYIKNYVNAANGGLSDSFIGYDTIISLVLSLRDLGDRLEHLENNALPREILSK